MANGIRVAQHACTALVYGSLYRFDLSQSSIQQRVGLLSMVSIGNFVQPLSAAIRTFPREKAIVTCERSKHLYSVMPYFTAKVLSELPLNLFNSLLFGTMLYPLVGLHRTLRKFSNFLSIGVMHSLASQSLGMLIRCKPFLLTRLVSVRKFLTIKPQSRIAPSLPQQRPPSR